MCILFLSFPLSFFHCSSFIQRPEKSRCGIAATIIVGGQRARERSSEEPPREQRSCDRGRQRSTVERRRDEVPRVSPAVHLSVNRRPSGKLPALSVHRATAWVLLFSGHCSTVFGTIRARNAPFSPRSLRTPAIRNGSFAQPIILPSFRELQVVERPCANL